MKKFDDFGKRMKEYEHAFRFYLPKRMPVVIRIDGCHFHSYTKSFTKPFDEQLIEAFWETGKFLGQQIMGCKLVYHQSDELSLLLTNYDKMNTESWFGNNLQKIVSVSASLATAKFNEMIQRQNINPILATFDSRAWILPQQEVDNYFIWRQQDAIKNSISMVAQSQFSAKQLHGLNTKQLLEKLRVERNINWADLPIWQQRGVCLVKKQHIKNNATRSIWDVDLETPDFLQERPYINQHIYINTAE
ncbi:tRNA(His)-5'-guanylyltransferase [Seinonella peptonophila]|uniref:tRNA(His)-5'-guanylyltransferase n=1 Tax=Seinonella peptonophila TaxID=112248 RepID=A0A1M4VIF3_9BACL|nr:tRNA(His) guanylyltransferase Thg1 family protein [Seinonella peptonophila]SHE68794.1 tRNA(His)-5'-guanylyltransferase [Seinonella peptonophila]